MTNEDNFNQTNSDLNLTVDSEVITISETTSNNNEKIDYKYRDSHDDYNSSSRAEDTERQVQYFPNVYSTIAAPTLEQHQNDLYTSDGISDDNDYPNSTIKVPKCVEKQPSNDRHLPDDILKLFPDLNEQVVVKMILLKVQHKIDEIWKEIDNKYKNYLMTPKLATQIQKYFDKQLESYKSKEFSSRVESINEAMSILRRHSFGAIFINTKNEVLGVQNHHDTWGAIKGHLRINDDGTLETPWEIFLRELFEELSITFETRKISKTINEKNIHDFLAMNKDKYLECYVDIKRNSNDGLRLIGLFVIRIDENQFKFTLNNNKENKKCEWLKMDDILSNKPATGRDKYYTLRPFVEYLKHHPELLQNN